MSDTSRNPQWDATMEARGVEAVRILLEKERSLGPTTHVAGLATGPGSKLEDRPPRGYVERWVARKDAERQARQEQREAKRDWWARGIAIAALIMAILAWLFPHK